MERPLYLQSGRPHYSTQAVGTVPRYCPPALRSHNSGRLLLSHDPTETAARLCHRTTTSTPYHGRRAWLGWKRTRKAPTISGHYSACRPSADDSGYWCPSSIRGTQSSSHERDLVRSLGLWGNSLRIRAGAQLIAMVVHKNPSPCQASNS